MKERQRRAEKASLERITERAMKDVDMNRRDVFLAADMPAIKTMGNLQGYTHWSTIKNERSTNVFGPYGIYSCF